MRMTHYFSLQCSIFLVGSVAATNPVTKIVFLGLAVIYLILQITTVKSDG
jgi:hypothetical protein